MEKLEAELVDSSTPAPEVTPEVTPPAEPSPTEEPTPTPDGKPEVTPPGDPALEVTPPAEVLYDLPDGRKVTAEVLKVEWQDNFLPEFTRKSQKLAEFEKLTNVPKDEPAWKDPNYVPKDYAEVIEIAKAAALDEIRGTYQKEQEQIANVKKEVDAQIVELKTLDPKLDENALFVHANKYGFKDLKQAYGNMTDMKKALVDVEKRTVKNLNQREAEPISTGPGGEVIDTPGYDPAAMNEFAGAADYLEFVKGKSK